jgi:lipid-binding SYLF domain-containing protein
MADSLHGILRRKMHSAREKHFLFAKNAEGNFILGGYAVNLKRRGTIVTIGILALAPFAIAKDAEKGKAEQDRLRNADLVMKEILNVPDNIPQDLLDKARCVIVMPSVLKAAFVVGGSYGRGTMVCRTGKDFTGLWGAPAMYALEGGSIGFQIGGEATDFVFLVMNDRGANSLLRSK